MVLGEEEEQQQHPMSSSSEGDAGSPRIHISMSKQLHGGTNGSAAMPKSVEMKSYSNANRIADKTIQAAIGTNPGLYKSVRKALKNQTLNFKINVECKCSSRVSWISFCIRS